MKFNPPAALRACLLTIGAAALGIASAPPAVAQRIVTPNASITGLPGPFPFTGKEWMNFRQDREGVTAPVATVVGQVVAAAPVASSLTGTERLPCLQGNALVSCAASLLSGTGGGAGKLNSDFTTLGAASSLAGTELLPTSQGGTTKSATVGQVGVAVFNQVPNLTAASTLTGTEVTNGVQGGSPVKITPAQVGSYVLATAIPALPAATALTGAEVSNVVQGGAPVKITVADVNQGSRYLGQVGTRTHIADGTNPSITNEIARRAEFARDDITSLQLVFGNFYTTSTGEAAPGATRTITASIEYPAGTFTQVKFSSATSASMADGLAQLVSDPIAVTIPRGARFWTVTWQSSTGGIMFAGNVQADARLGDQVAYSNSQADTTMSTWTGTASGPQYGPFAVIAMTRRPSIALVADSRGQGIGGSSPLPYSGQIAPALAPFYGFLDLSESGQTAQQQAGTGFTRRATYLQYVTHAVLQLGINDILTNTTSAVNVAAYRQTIRSFAPNLKWFETTLDPKSTSTDSFATLTNQTTNANNQIRVDFNDQVRAGDPGFEGMFDLADATESARNSGIWKAPPMTPAAITADGTHSNNAGYGLARPYINPGVIRR